MGPGRVGGIEGSGQFEGNCKMFTPCGQVLLSPVHPWIYAIPSETPQFLEIGSHKVSVQRFMYMV